MKLLVKEIWKKIPRGLRLRLVRFWQHSFTVSAAAIVLNDEGKVLLLNHVLRPFSGWGLPGGFVEHGESSEAAIRRELQEETGIELANLELYRVRTVGKHVEILFTATGIGEARVNSREIIELGWFSAEEFPKGLSPAQQKVISDVLER